MLAGVGTALLLAGDLNKLLSLTHEVASCLTEKGTLNCTMQFPVNINGIIQLSIRNFDYKFFIIKMVHIVLVSSYVS